MIEYDKLKQAHELADDLKTMDSRAVLLTNYLHFYGDGDINQIFKLLALGENFEFSSLDDLIAKLEELTAPKPKFEIGEIVWFSYTLIGNKVHLHLQPIFTDLPTPLIRIPLTLPLTDEKNDSDHIRPNYQDKMQNYGASTEYSSLYSLCYRG